MTEKHRDWHYLLDRDLAFGNSVPRAVAAGVTSAICLPANKARKQAIFINDSDTTLYITKGAAVALNAGIRLNNSGGTYIDTPDSLGYLWVGAWSVISSAANKNLIVIEDV